ncbi:MAG: hypothetical protein CMI19_06845 [Opitutae bacterium]|nr:hypothetical protein [Opitutae bacterium]|tara:strand:+ start:1097 stop:3703 length:2607 start_codon:yes stop_codon:yes gene_type:complete
MQGMFLFHKILILLFGVAISVQAVPPVLNYAGQVAVNGEAFDGAGLFKFALVNADGTNTYWSNDGTSVGGSEPQASVSVPVDGGLYAVLLGNTALQGMGAIDPAVFAQHNDAKLRVWFSDGVNGFQQLSPDRPFASVPYAFSAESAKSADSANVATTAMAVQAGAITKQMLGQDVLSDLNRTVNHNDLSPKIKADINATIGMNRLSSEVTEKLNQEKTTTNYNAPSVGSLLAVPYGSDAPAGYSLYQRGEPKELVWEEKAAFSQPRAFLGSMLQFSPNGKIFALGGHVSPSTSYNLVESYDPLLNIWITKQPLTEVTFGQASTYYENKIYVLGGYNLSKVEVYDPQTNEWSVGTELPVETRYGSAVTLGSEIYFGGGRQSNTILNTFYSYSSAGNWIQKANMNLSRNGHRSLVYEDKIWIIGGANNNDGKLRSVEIYNPDTNSWINGPSLVTKRSGFSCWVWDNKIFVAGGFNENGIVQSIEYFDNEKGYWQTHGTLPTPNKYSSATALNDKIYIFGGVTGTDSTGTDSYSNKLYAADLNASMEGIYDLYRKDGNAPVGTPVVQSEYADGSVTTAKLDSTILKYLKPEITAQPQAQMVYADTNVSYSVTAEGKYLTYQWKKDGVDLTGETNDTLTITDANATQHDGNYSVVVSNDFGSVESNKVEVKTSDALLNGLVGWWKFDETSGTVAYDSSGNGNDGSLTGGPTWATGKIGGALSFDGVDDYVLVSKDFGSTVSISAWAKRVSGNNVMLWCFGNQSSGPDLFFSHNKICLNTWDSDTNLFGIFLVEANEWYNFSTIISSVETKLYVDGTLLGSANYRSTAEKNFYISMKEQGQGDYAWNGSVDDVRIYDRALSAEEVQALYKLGQ